MGNFVAGGKASQYRDGTKQKVQVEGQEILLARVGDKFYAVSNRCPHLGGDLSAGSLEGTVITCPKHGSQFSLTDGQVLRWLKGPGLLATVAKAIKPPRPLQTYNVRVEDDTLLIEI